ncbi:MAG: RdgB/HAM1 family non-canonical purine NTP pyrophosphatase [Clostridia bacterium]|nr:RdgB/HAM1 family non-canonical purine NTP pyrophosphatase [Clostridia bacterium]
MKFFIATKNPKKLKELKRILEPLGIDAVCESDLDIVLPEVEETGITFSENAMLKAVSGMNATGLVSIADDSGLCVDALGGEPGVYSARYSGPDSNDNRNIEKLLKSLKDVPYEKRTARFVTVVACVFPDGRSFTAEGVCEGHITTEKHGDNGFGYDPVFETEKGVFGELDSSVKDAISHRGKALKKFSEIIKDYI